MTHNAAAINRLLSISAACVLLARGIAGADQRIVVDGNAAGPAFDGVGAVSGGGATSVLLKDYPPKQRDEVLDVLFKPNFAASIQTLYVEVGGDGNSTQGSEPTHMRSRTDENYFRGYEWWLMTEAKRRNAALTLDACAWSAPAWVGDGQFWSQDMADYYVKWVKGLQAEHGTKLDAIGCRNERGDAAWWLPTFRRTLDAAGLNDLPIHAFDNAGNPSQWNWIPALAKDKAVQNAVAIAGNHCMTDAPMSDAVRGTLRSLHKTVWNTEEHVYNEGQRTYADDYAAAIGCVHLFNANYIDRGATKIINWYLVGSTYPFEPYADQPPAMIARSPWSGHYRLKPIVWSYAHYGQFVKVGWKYLPESCKHLDGGGTVVAMRSADGDYSLIAETAGATAAQTITFRPTGGLSAKPPCIWRTTRDAQFVRQPDPKPAADGTVTLTLEPNAIYSLSTTTGQQKGQFADVPEDRPFPLPYFEDFDHYGDPKTRGYLPRYTADIAGVFELAGRRDGGGTCLKQVVDRHAQSWAPEWKPYTVLGDANWTDYEVSADVLIDDFWSGGWVGVMGRVSNTGNGWDNDPNGYYCRLYYDGGVQLFSADAKYHGSRDRQIGTGAAGAAGTAKWKGDRWHNLKLRFEGRTITVLVDGTEVLHVQDDDHARGAAGLIAGGEGTQRTVASYDDLLINIVGGTKPDPAAFADKTPPIYPGK